VFTSNHVQALEDFPPSPFPPATSLAPVATGTLHAVQVNSLVNLHSSPLLNVLALTLNDRGPMVLSVLSPLMSPGMRKITMPPSFVHCILIHGALFATNSRVGDISLSKPKFTESCKRHSACWHESKIVFYTAACLDNEEVLQTM
jgi:hypothetical protein